MAVVSPVPAISQRLDHVRLHEIGVSAVMSSTGEIVEEPPLALVVEDKIFVAVGKELKESKLNLVWALQNSGGKRISIVHVHQPAQMIPIMGGKFPASKLKEQEVRAYRDLERQDMHKILNDYLLICRQAGARAEKLYIESENVEKGILELISEHGIKKLVVGAAADKHYSRRMLELKSKKAAYVRDKAPLFCHIWFVCKGHLIYTREGCMDGADIELRTPPSQQASPNNETGQSNTFRSMSVSLGQNHQSKLVNPGQGLPRTMSVPLRITVLSSPDGTGGVSAPWSRMGREGSSNYWDGISKRSPSQGSGFSTCSSGDMAGEVNEDGSESRASPLAKQALHHSSPPSVLEENIYDQLEQAMVEAENSRREAFQQSLRRSKAEKDAIEAIRRAKEVERSFSEELKLRRDVEEALQAQGKELESLRNKQQEIMEELKISLNHKSLLENQIADSEQVVKELEEKIISAVELLQNYKKERDELQIERDNALKTAEELKKKGASTSHTPQYFAEFSFAELEKATQNFDPSVKIGEGGYGSIYKGCLRHTQVAIKMLHSDSFQGPSEFQQEVDVLSKLRHPNLVTLIGACPEAWALIYEYLPNGSLEDRLNCRDNTPPLSWQARIRIAAELCSVLIFLHSNNPDSIVHGDLKPSNILLDANFGSKLSDFGICRVISHDENSSNSTTMCCRTGPKGTFAYIDPEFLSSGELTVKSDVYSFGIILLRLLTGKQAIGITKEVQQALDQGNLNTLLDPLAGDWPFVQAKQLALMALRCCEMNRKSRPDLVSEVWRVLEPMKVSCGASSSSFRVGSEERGQIPPYFICPIFQEIMQDPCVAADGFTYEAEALRGWLDGGHSTSPMTNLKLGHLNLVPNRALRSAIQEWLQQP
ncbi:hypothetical protein PVL29_020364 [Vitis rotundifolia]|uniref:RING-type E3 ubiquitin transferase n=1 Tax=Vitis rotundifolia TaxID=103349 RepID=A0AA39DF10_VITRO|nr:hypothetical protein PVL29_020364 [Vitis rotundifolia]